jgi:SAM-dependent methyltransferase
MSTPGVAPGNAEQAAAWDGADGAYWATHSDVFERSGIRLHRVLMDALPLTPGARLLDVGCGAGQVTREAARAASRGSALGVDLSTAMLDIARRKAREEGLTNVTFERADAQVYPFGTKAFDIVVSRFGVMFFDDKPAAFANLARALRPGGTLALLVWQAAERNEWFTSFVTALAAGRELPRPSGEGPHPFSMADPARVRPMLESAGFGDVDFEAFAAPMNFGATVDEAYDFLLGLFGWLLDDLSESAAEGAQRALRASLEQHLGSDGVTYDSAAWLLTARRP